MLEKYIGEQFNMSIVIPAFGYNDCSEIEIILYNKYDTSKTVRYLKTDSTIENNSNRNDTIDILISSSNTKTLGKGLIILELKRTVSGENMPIIKLRSEFMVLYNSKIE